MKNKLLLRWGGISALFSVALFIVSIASYWVAGGLDFRARVPLFSVFACFLFIATIASYEFLSEHQYSFARAGLVFAALSILTFFLEAAVWGADQMVIRAGAAQMRSDLSEMMALFNSLHMMVLWFIAIWMTFWGLGFLRVSGKGKVAGIFMCLLAGFHLVDYLLARLDQTGLFVELWHLGSQALLLCTFTTLGLLLLEASRSSEE